MGVPVGVPGGVGKDDDNNAGDDEADPRLREGRCWRQRILCLVGGYRMPQAWRLVSGVREEGGELATGSSGGGY